jgi:hypothetical protein
MVGKLQPLANNFAIVGPDGKPTEYFIRWAQQRQIDIGEAVGEARALEIVQAFIDDYALQAGSGIAITPDGKLTSNPTISAQAQAILNQISTVHGTILFRGATNWQALAPGTAGQVLSTNGAGTDPSWIATGGGGAGVPLIPFPDSAPGSNSGNINVPLISLVPCVAVSADPVTGLIIPCSTTVAGRTAAPCIYDGGPFSAPTTAANTPRVAVGPGVALTINSMIACPFDTPFTPTPGRLYYAGFSFYGTAGAINLWASKGGRSVQVSGTFNPPPTTFPASVTNISSVNTGWWSY